ncbi:MAG: protein-glutamate O-methyltransferase CheR [Planctomycetota bacterium]
MTITADDFAWVSNLVQQRAGIQLEPGKEYLVESRLIPVAKRHGRSGLGDLVQLLRSYPDREIVNDLIEAMTTNETSFFRDVAPFEALRKTILPRLVQRRSARRRLRIWCAASSSGQEPYSLGILLLEHFPEVAKSWDFRFLATDLSRHMVQRCLLGEYTRFEVGRGLSPQLRERYFEPRDNSFVVVEPLRRLVEFRTMNLCEPWPSMEAQDLVLVRNVMIYFDVPTKQRILQQVRRILQPDGFVLLGTAESMSYMQNEFEREALEGTSVYSPTALPKTK